jgi:hypothetical protein
MVHSLLLQCGKGGLERTANRGSRHMSKSSDWRGAVPGPPTHAPRTSRTRMQAVQARGAGRTCRHTQHEPAHQVDRASVHATLDLCSRRPTQSVPAHLCVWDAWGKAVRERSMRAVSLGERRLACPSISETICGLLSFCWPPPPRLAVSAPPLIYSHTGIQTVKHMATARTLRWIGSGARTSVLKPGVSMLAGKKWYTRTQEPASSLRSASARPA